MSRQQPLSNTPDDNAPEEEYLVQIVPPPPNPSGIFIPPLRFAIVEKDVYRGSYPRPLNFPFLETLGLKTLLSITPAPVIAPVAEWCTANGIKIVHLPPTKSKKKSIPLQHGDVKRAIEAIISQSTAPVYVHCLNGSEATGLVMACLRKLQFWATPAIFTELQRFSELHSSFEAFLEGFVDEVEIPEDVADWLWQGMKDEEGVIGRHRVEIRYKNAELERKRVARLAREIDACNNTLGMNGTGSESAE